MPARRPLILALACSIGLLLCTTDAGAIENKECLECHGDKSIWDLTSPKEAGKYVEAATFEASIHGAMSCTDCHNSIKELPHEETLPLVDCGACHDAEAKLYATSLHGQAVAKGDPLAPHCWDCHGRHDIIPASDPKSRTNPIHVPDTCGSCHGENAPVAKSRNIEQHDILQNYEEGIHGEGLKKKGLSVTAVCTSCHTAHHVLPHTDPESTINRNNVVKTCTKCHSLIEQVHRKVIQGELWEKEPEKVPICIDCHQPHKTRRVFYDEGVSDKDCLTCHAKEVQGATRTLTAVNSEELAHSTHAKSRCAQCHTGTSPNLVRACETVAKTVDCGICHADQVAQYRVGIHGKLAAKGDPDAPGCLDCHSGHGTKSKTDPDSPTFPNKVPTLCARCHLEGQKAAVRHNSAETDIISNYSESIHGKGLLKSGLVVTAMCTDCHTPHQPLPASDPESSVNPKNIPATCGRCHYGVEAVFNQSIHSATMAHTDKPLPVCSGCHTAHSIRRTDTDQFKFDVMQTCGRCHEEVARTYFDTYHGKVSKLGSAGAAKCFDCHGSHDVLAVSDPRSHLSRNNIVATCAKCHPGSNRRFAGYLTHATHHDPKKYPALFWTFWAMTALLVGTFGFFGLHTLIWLPRSFTELRHKRSKAREVGSKQMVRRFDPIVRQLHFVLILCFFGLALTGMQLKFSYMPWAQWLSHATGGFKAAGVIHRVCAVVMVIVFILHLGYMVHLKRLWRKSWKEMLFGRDTLLPRWEDIREFAASMRWFMHKGPQPGYGQWTYWEKFDYFAVFWGVAIIGSTGLMLWFPEQFTRLLPGWLINVATIIHSDEALLAVGFIFTIHFFNTNFRPDKFPMDTVMFTGSMPLEEFKRERPRHYEELVKTGKLEEHLVPPASASLQFWATLFGAVALIVGFSLVLFILWSMVFGYR